VDVRTHEVTAPARRLRGVALVLALAVCALPLAASSAGAANFTWTGAATLGKWSNATNWGGIAPNGEVGTLTFPTLTSAVCTAEPQKATCYSSENDVSGLNVNAISIDDGANYLIHGGPITLGAGGLTASGSADSSGDASLSLPITLGTSQNWSIGGNGNGSRVDLGTGGGVTGTSAALNISLSDQATLGFGANNNEVGAVTVAGTGILFPGSVTLGPGSGSLNGTDGNPVSLSGGAGLAAFDGTTGPLTMTAGLLQVGCGCAAGTLAVNGGVTLNSAVLMTFINHSGTTAGTDYSQLSASGSVNLAGTHLVVLDGQGQGASACQALRPGDVDMLITTGGLLTGTFIGVPDGTTIPVYCPFQTPPLVRINYSAHSVTATVQTAGSGREDSTTTTTLSPSLATAVTNQLVTLTATVTANSGPPSGTVSFQNNGAPIAGCESQPVILVGASYIATCQKAFTAASSPESLTAVFTPTGGSSLQGSSSSTEGLTVGNDSTTTALNTSSNTPAAGASVTYTATVTPSHSGSTEPSGSVRFLDSGTPIGSCASQPLTQGGSSSSATCALSYPTAGAHAITATYLPDANFTGSSSSPAQTVTVQGGSLGTGEIGVLGSKITELAAPVLGVTANLQPISGVVLVELPGTSTFIPLSLATTVPIGTVIDARNGTVRITSAADAHGHTETGLFSSGIFRVTQTTARSGLHGGHTVVLTVLTLVGPLPSGCKARRAGHRATAAGSRGHSKGVRRLWGNAKGNFRTAGRYASATVRGTNWLTEDTCAGTLIRVTRGIVSVEDFPHHRTLLLRASHSFLSHPGRGG
jgi:hypothetical protein